MHPTWRQFLYYIFGFLPSIFFGLRFIIQWLKSEKEKRSHVNTTFWYLSFSGNILLAIHYFIQIQYPFLMIQIINGFVSWRNINLLNKKRRPASFKGSVIVLIGSIILSSLLFYLQKHSLSADVLWLDIPFGLIGQKNSHNISLVWHIFGIFGCFLFGSRFWIQWLEAEKTGRSSLGKNFWILSIMGSAIALTYFLRIGDWVSSINYSCGLIPYMRNLVLIRREDAITNIQRL